MTRRPRTVALALAAVVGILMLVTLYRGPRATMVGSGDEPDVRVRCASVLTVGWPSDTGYVADDTSLSWSDHVEGDEPQGDQARASIARECADRRDTYTAFLVLLSVPFSVLLSVAVLRRNDPSSVRRPPTAAAAAG